MRSRRWKCDHPNCWGPPTQPVACGLPDSSPSSPRPPGAGSGPRVGGGVLVKQKQEENAHFPKVFCRVDTHEHWDPARVVLGVHTHHVGASGREWARRDPLEGRREPPEQRRADLSAGLAGPEAADGTGAAAVFGRRRGSSPGQVMVWLKEAGKGGRHVFGAPPVSVLLPGSQQRGRGAHRKEGQRCQE